MKTIDYTVYFLMWDFQLEDFKRQGEGEGMTSYEEGSIFMDDAQPTLTPGIGIEFVRVTDGKEVSLMKALRLP